MNKLQKIFYTMVFLALSFPAKAFGMAELYGTTQVMYGSPTLLYGISPVYTIPWYVLAGRYLLYVALPIIVLIVIIVAVIRLTRKKK